MKKIFNKIGLFVLAMILIGVSSCDEKLTDLNENPNGIKPEDGNVNLLMPTVLGPTASRYLDLGVNNMAGAMQHTQKSGWAGGHNYYGWDAQDWTGYFDVLRTNQLLIQNANENGFPFHEGVGLTMRAFIYGQIADYWGDVPFSAALKGHEGGIENQYPKYDTQEAVYTGVLADLQAAAALFASGDDTFVDGSVDLYFGGDMEAWERFANSLIIRYSVRISEKNSSVKGTVESIVSSEPFITSSDQDATMDYTGGSNDQWPIQYDNETSSTRYQACKTLIDQMTATNDPRIRVWFDPVRVRWVQDNTISGEESQMRVDGVLEDIWPDWIDYRGSTQTFTRHFNPADVDRDDSEFVGIEAGIFQPDVHIYNGNPVGGQGRHNIHASMLTETFMDGQAGPGDLLQARLVSAAEMHFTLAEMAVKGWNVGDAQTHYEAGIKASLETWGVDDQYDSFIAEVPFDGTVEQVITQKWVASFASATEAWNDYKRTGLPVLSVGEGAIAPVPAIRFGYGGDELNNNTENVNAAIEHLEITDYSGQLGKNSPYSRQWLLQGTGKPW
ncbi:MAG: SusD/RagB family nutrient-binding outer membrane lipoprotein [Cytophagales bacterium]|nr:SusD/RagB family nutrient-binding outer membrane lipoprotein [Cytophagales bacterium]